MPGQSGTMVLGDGSSTGLMFVSRAVLAQIYAEADARAHTGPHEHFEVGGLLIGPSPQNRDLLVEEAIPLGLEYRFEPSFPMLLAGLDSIEPAITAARKDGSSTIVGLYRILTRSDTRLRDRDFETLGAIEKNPSSLPGFHCCFVFAPTTGSAVSLRVLMRNEENWEEIQEVTLHVEPAVAMGHAAAEGASPRPAPSSSALLNAATRAPRLVAGEPAGPKTAPDKDRGIGASNRKAAVFSAFALVALIAVGGVYRWTGQRHAAAADSRAPSSAIARTGFSANRDGAAWKLTWDSAAVEAMKPTGALLSIQDGAGQQDIALSMADLSSGTIYYTPKSGELAFRLQVLRDGTPLAEERVRVLEGIKPAPKPPDQFQRSSGPGVQPGAGLTNPESQEELSDAVAAGGENRNAVARKFVPPHAISRTDSAPILSAAGPITTLAIPQAPSLNGGFRVPPAPAQAPPAPSPAITPQPPASGALAAKAPPIPVPAKAEYIGPKPARQVQPQAPPGFTGKGAIQVEVLVAIDAKGKVTKVTPVGSAQDFRVVEAATKAASFWQFEPARLNGKAIASEMTLIFRF
jgi:hypothetical protein